jgi:hypothetical protein
VIEYCGVGSSAEFFCYAENGIPTKQISRPKVRRAVLFHGVQAQYPALQVVLGVALMGALAWPVLRVQDFLQYGGSLSYYDFLLGALSLPGGWLIYDAFKRGWVLKLELERGVAKLAFNREAELDGLREFVRRANFGAGPPIEMP